MGSICVDQGLRVISAECCGCLGSSCGFGFAIDLGFVVLVAGA